MRLMKRKLHVVSNTHWDREHRHSFQETRIMLVELIDELVEIMENDPEYKYFTFDGQSIVLHDYLEVKPHMKDRLTRLIKDNRILIGPWYTLVDCYSVNPESIIRNLLIGHKVCSEFGEPMKVGYSIFSFGQMAQLPQVYAGFGIKDIIFYKGASSEVLPQSEFIWVAPDGTEAFASRLGKEKRWNFYFDFDIPVMLGGNARKPGWQAKFTDTERLFHMNDESYVNTYSTLLQPDIRIRRECIKECIDKVMKDLEESASDRIFLAFQGTDFTSPLRQTPEVIKCANEIMGDSVELVHSNPVEYFKEVKEDIDVNSLVRHTGEMRFGPVSSVHSETMGTNTEIKQAIFKAENTILNYAEPLSSFLKVNGGKYEKDILDLAWRYLLAAHAHDSIHGSGDPKIKTDNLNRLEQVQEIADSVTRRAVEGIAGIIDMSGFEKGEILVAVFNTTPYERNEVVKLTIDLPEEELVQDYWLEDINGNRLEIYQLSKYKYNLAMIHRAYRPKSVYSERVEIHANVCGIPPMGYKLLKIKRIKGSSETSTNPFPQGYFPYNPIGKPGNVLDNGLIRVSINDDGTVSIFDYETKTATGKLNYFIDTGCSGDFWVHREPYNNSILTTRGGRARIELIRNSYLSATYRVTTNLDIPEGLTADRLGRSKNTIHTEIISEITVNKGSKRVDFKTSIDNKSKDHMLIASFSTGIDSDYADWECPFEIRARDVEKFSNNNGIKGPELERQAVQNFIDVSDGTRGVALFTKGIKEAGTIRGEGAIINLTLFRATTGTFPIHNDLQVSFENETSQCMGRQTFEYSIYMHRGNFKEGNVIAESRKYATPLISAEIGSGTGGCLKGDISFMKLNGGQLVLHAVKLAEDGKGIVMRLSNPTGDVVKEEISFMNGIKVLYITNMNEETEREMDIKGKSIDLEVAPYKIVTLYLLFENMSLG